MTNIQDAEPLQETRRDRRLVPQEKFFDCLEPGSTQESGSKLKKKRVITFKENLKEIEEAWATGFLNGTYLKDWASVPLECIALIFSFCDIEDMPKVEIVCQEWRELTRNSEVRRVFILYGGPALYEKLRFGEIYNPLQLCRGESPFQGDAWKFLLMSKMEPDYWNTVKSVGAFIRENEVECIKLKNGRVLYEGENSQSLNKRDHVERIPNGYGVCYHNSDTKSIGTWSGGKLMKGFVLNSRGEEVMRIDEVLTLGCMGGGNHPILATGWCKFEKSDRDGYGIFEGSWVMSNAISMNSHMCVILTFVQMVQGKLVVNKTTFEGIFCRNKLIKGTKTNANNSIHLFVDDSESFSYLCTPMNVAKFEAIRMEVEGGQNLFFGRRIQTRMEDILGQFLGRVVMANRGRQQQMDDIEDVD